jgi:hypothetical protein
MFRDFSKHVDGVMPTQCRTQSAEGLPPCDSPRRRLDVPWCLVYGRISHPCPEAQARALWTKGKPQPHLRLDHKSRLR